MPARLEALEESIREHQARGIELLERGGDALPAAKRELARAAELAIRGYGAEVKAWLSRRAGGRELAEDLFQEASTGLWRGMKGFRWECTARSWFYKIAFYALCHHSRTAPSDPRWALLLREAARLSRADAGPLTARFLSALKRLHRRVILAREEPETAAEEEAALKEGLRALARDAALREHEGLRRWQAYLGENLFALAAATKEQPAAPTECALTSAELSQAALDLSSMSSQLDKRQKLLASLSRLKEPDRLLILLRQVEGGGDWREIALAWNGYQRLGESALDAEAARLRQRFHRALAELRTIARAKGLAV
jgi:RNA polymerase sigma factor (sigma-70 family)